MDLCESWPPHAERRQNEAISPLTDVAGAARTHKEVICSRCNRLKDGAASSAAAGDATRQSGANIRSLNKRSLRTLKGNEAHGVAVCVYYRQRTIQNPKKYLSHMKRREKATGDRTVILDGVGFCSHPNNEQSCYKLCRGQKSNTSYLLPEMGTPETISQTHTVLPARLQLF